MFKDSGFIWDWKRGKEGCKEKIVVFKNRRNNDKDDK